MKKFVLFHKYVETDFISIVAFGDTPGELWDVMVSQARYGSSRHEFLIFSNYSSDWYKMPMRLIDPFGNKIIFCNHSLKFVKDSCLINICKNVAEYLSVGEYAMLKKSYFKSLAWFDKAKNSASLGVEILENY